MRLRRRTWETASISSRIPIATADARRTRPSWPACCSRFRASVAASAAPTRSPPAKSSRASLSRTSGCSPPEQANLLDRRARCIDQLLRLDVGRDHGQLRIQLVPRPLAAATSHVLVSEALGRGKAGAFDLVQQAVSVRQPPGCLDDGRLCVTEPPPCQGQAHGVGCAPVSRPHQEVGQGVPRGRPCGQELDRIGIEGPFLENR